MILFKPSSFAHKKLYEKSGRLYNSPQDQADQSEFASYLITSMSYIRHLSQLLCTYHSLYENLSSICTLKLYEPYIHGILSLCNMCQRAKKCVKMKIVKYAVLSHKLNKILIFTQ